MSTWASFCTRPKGQTFKPVLAPHSPTIPAHQVGPDEFEPSRSLPRDDTGGFTAALEDQEADERANGPLNEALLAAAGGPEVEWEVRYESQRAAVS